MKSFVGRLGAAFDRASSFLGRAWRPTELAGCRLWLRASSGVSRAGPLARSWRDRASWLELRAPSLRDAPSFVARHAALGEHPAVSFEAPGEHLAIEGEDLGVRDAFSLFVVLVPEGVGASSGFAVSLSDDVTLAGLRVGAANELLAFGGRHLPSRVRLLSGRPYVVALVKCSCELSLLLDGVSLVKTSAIDPHTPAPKAPVRLAIGAPPPVAFHGAIADVVLFDRALEHEEIATVDRELALHYDLARRPRRAVPD